MDTQAYLKRIAYVGPLAVNEGVLMGLCRAHLRAVPFENLDIHLGVPIRLDSKALFRKIVRRRRGGFCYELNSLFAELLTDLGFEVRLLEARVLRAGKDSGPRFDHMALSVGIGDRDYLVDVGFGDGSTLPLPMRAGSTRLVDGRFYRLSEVGSELLYQVQAGPDEGKGYMLNLRPRHKRDFYATSRWHQSNSASWFTKSLICVRSEPETISLIDGRLKINGCVTEIIDDTGRYLDVLRTLFDIDLPRLPENMRATTGWRLRHEAAKWQERGQKAMAMIRGSGHIAGSQSLL